MTDTATETVIRPATNQRGGQLYQHTCGRVKAFTTPPANGECRVAHIVCDHNSTDPNTWQPLYRLEATR